MTDLYTASRVSDCKKTTTPKIPDHVSNLDNTTERLEVAVVAWTW